MTLLRKTDGQDGISGGTLKNLTHIIAGMKTPPTVKEAVQVEPELSAEKQF